MRNLFRCEEYANFVLMWHLCEFYIDFYKYAKFVWILSFANSFAILRLCWMCIDMKALRIVYRCDDNINFIWMWFLFKFYVYFNTMQFCIDWNITKCVLMWIMCEFLSIRSLRELSIEEKYMQISFRCELCENCLLMWRIYKNFTLVKTTRILYRCSHLAIGVSIWQICELGIGATTTRIVNGCDSNANVISK